MSPRGSRLLVGGGLVLCFAGPQVASAQAKFGQDTAAAPRWILPTSRVEMGDSLRLWLFVPRADSGIERRVRFEVLGSPASTVELADVGKCGQPSLPPQAGDDLLIFVCGIARADGVARIVAWIEDTAADRAARKMVLSDPLSVTREGESNALSSTLLTAASGAVITIFVFLIQQSWTRRQDRKDRDQQNQQEIKKEEQKHRQEIKKETAVLGKGLYKIMIQEVSSNREHLMTFLKGAVTAPAVLAMRGSEEILANPHFKEYLNEAYGDKLNRFLRVYELAREFNYECRRHDGMDSSDTTYLNRMRKRAELLVGAIDACSPDDAT
ncbi:MAG: hypothetical protein ABR543_03745 [Gemmatimonadaceae bacterium]